MEKEGGGEGEERGKGGEREEMVQGGRERGRVLKFNLCTKQPLGKML